ncbi:MAG: hypothetical protein ACR2IT_06065, partial [Pirellulales bacterium]
MAAERTCAWQRPRGASDRPQGLLALATEPHHDPAVGQDRQRGGAERAGRGWLLNGSMMGVMALAKQGRSKAEARPKQ